jgi:hypothetical protein
MLQFSIQSRSLLQPNQQNGMDLGSQIARLTKIRLPVESPDGVTALWAASRILFLAHSSSWSGIETVPDCTKPRLACWVHLALWSSRAKNYNV